MKRTLFQRILSIFGLSVLSVLFFTCHDAPQVLEQQKVKVTFTVKDNAARTVLPSLAGIASFKLLGGKIGTAETTLVDLFTGTGISVALDPGIWNFTLNAYNDSGENILQGKIRNKQINLTGTNQVSFSLSVINSGTGSIQITLNFPEIAGITRISTTGDAGSENFIPSTGGSFVYTKTEIAAGDYFINFEFYRGNVLRTVISELVLVRNGLTSSKTITLVGDDLKQLVPGTVTISPAVSATIGTELTAIYSGTETVTYQWNKDGFAISNATGTKYTPNSPGSYTVTVNVAGYNIGLISAVVAVVGSVTNVPGTTLQAKLVWLANNAESNSNYNLEVSENDSIPSFTLSYSGKSNIVITIKSTDSMRNIYSENDVMFTVGSGIILVLDNDITLCGWSTGGGTLVSVDGTFVMNTGSTLATGSVNVLNNGTFIMYGGTIEGNKNVSIDKNYTNYDYKHIFSSGGGVYVRSGGTFIMSGGTISNNIAPYFYKGSFDYFSYGGGVSVSDGGTFIMSGGTISNNTTLTPNSVNLSGSWRYLVGGSGVSVNGGTFIMSGGTISGNTNVYSYGSSFGSSYGGGVYVRSGGTFTMNGGTISDNTASMGGGVSVEDGTFTMNGGTISDNTASWGGGVSVEGETFIMNGGEISGNTVTLSGGGVNVRGGIFIKIGGTIYGYNTGDNKSNVVKNQYDTPMQNRGHVAYVEGYRYVCRESTAGPDVKLSCTVNPPTFSGGWEVFLTQE